MLLQGSDRLSAHSCVHEARAYLANTGQSAAVVTSNGQPVGVVTAEALDRWSPPNAPITAVMDYVAVHVNPAADAEGTLRAFTAAAWEWLRPRR